MREHKYRAWDTVRKKMFSAAEMGEDQLGLLPDGTGFWNISSTSPKLSQRCVNLLPLEYTGLKDKSGTEIYEGDWCRECFSVSRFTEESDGRWRKLHEGIKGHWDTEPQTEVFVVETVFAIYKRIIGLQEIVSDKSEMDLLSGKFFEVIGNIYSNPELLEKEKSKP